MSKNETNNFLLAEICVAMIAVDLIFIRSEMLSLISGLLLILVPTYFAIKKASVNFFGYVFLGITALIPFVLLFTAQPNNPSEFLRKLGAYAFIALINQVIVVLYFIIKNNE